MTALFIQRFALLILSVTIAQPATRIPTLKRLQPDYLKRAHEDVAALAKARKPITVKTGYNDYRCIIHAHSSLSHDSRGTIAEIATAAKAVGVDAVFLTNHPKKDEDVVAAGQHDPVDGVLFVPGAETNGFLAFPGDNKLPRLDVSEQQFVDSIRATNGLIFVAHPEEHKDWTLRGLTGTEIYNTHADLKDETELVAALRPKNSAGYGQLLSILNAMKASPQEGFAALFDPQMEALAHYDTLSKERPYAAIAGNDSHQNTGFVLTGAEEGRITVSDALGEKIGELDTKKNPLLTTLFGQPVPGKELFRRILDPYPVSFHYVSTHVLAKERTVPSLLEALAAGRTYVAFDWMADPTGTAFVATDTARTWSIGDAPPLSPGLRLRVALPLPASIRILKDGTEVAHANGRALDFTPTETGVYRAEAALTIAGEKRPWVYTGAIRILKAAS